MSETTPNPGVFVKTDLHGHTLHSDGRATPEEFVEFRHRLGMKAIAITDHDLMASVRPGALAAERAGILFIPGLEVTAHLHYGQSGEEQFHVLAYFPHDFLNGFKLEATVLFRRGQLVQKRWKELVCQWLSEQSPGDRAAIDPDGMLEKLPPTIFPALQSMILRLLDRKRELLDSFRERHILFWSSEGSNKDLFGWTPQEAIEAIRGDGAVDVVAHAARYRDKDLTMKVLEEARGIEVYTSRHKAEVAAQYRAIAEAGDKYWTSSTDDHQNARYVEPVCGTPLRTLERICRNPMSLASIIAA